MSEEQDSGPDADEMRRDFHSAVERLRRKLILNEPRDAAGPEVKTAEPPDAEKR